MQATKIERAESAGRTTPSDDDWFVKSLIIVLGLGGAALVLAVVSADERVVGAFSRVRSRMQSRGLSTKRVSLGEDNAAQDRRGTIRYRD